MKSAHSNHEPGALHSVARIGVRFVPLSPIPFQVKQSDPVSEAMNTSNPKQNEMTPPTLFQMAACFEDFFPGGDSGQPAPALRQAPFADLGRHFQNLKAMVKSVHPQNNAAPRRDGPIPVSRAIRRATSGKSGTSGAGKSNGHALRELKKVEFTLEAPAAASVKLAADFTNWEKHPVEMMHSPDGFWFTVVPLTRGKYFYRFIVDGEWRDDPRATRRAPNPFGTENAVVQV